MMEEKTDIDRLHAVINGKLTGRGCGKTYATCHEIAGFVEVGETEILCIVPIFGWLTWLRAMLIEVLQEHGLEVQFLANDALRCGESTIRFILDRHRDLVGRSGLVLDFNDGIVDPRDLEYFKHKVCAGLGVPEEFLQHAESPYAIHGFWPRKWWPR
jgi:hypothetical protein